MKQAVQELKQRLNISESVASELLILAGDDVDLAEDCSRKSTGLNECKARIINERFRQLEDELFED